MAMILTGHQRCGTTLLRRLCSEHPDLAVLNELGCYMAVDQPAAAHTSFMLSRWKNRLTTKRVMTPGLAVPDSKRQRAWLNSKFLGRYLSAIWRQGGGVVDSAVIDRALRAALPGYPHVGDKYPDYYFSLDRLAGDDINRCVVIYRDPRDIAASALPKARGTWQKFWPPEMKQAAIYGKRWIILMRAIERNQDRLHVLRYEELVREPERVLAGLADYLQVDPAGFDTSAVHADSVGSFRRRLTAAEIAEVEETAGSLMALYGYD